MKKSIAKKFFLILIAVGILPMVLFAFLTVSGYQDIINKQAPYLEAHPELLKETNLNYKNIQIQTFLIFILLSIFIIFFSIILTRKYLYPIKRLIKGTEQIMKGDLTTTINLKTDDEFESLASSFNQMAKNLSVKINDLRKEKLKSEEEKQKTLSVISNFIDPILVLDRRDKLSLFNPAAERVFGLSLEQLGEEISDDDNYSMNNFSKISARSFEVKKIDDRNPEEDGSEELSLKINDHELIYRVSTIKILNHDDNEYLGTMKVFYNITREKEIDRLKSEFISIAAHQLRTPLSAIKWVVEMILNEDAGPVNEEQRQLLIKSKQSNERIINLVNDLLNVSRIEEGRFGYSFKKESLKDVLDPIIEELKPAIDRKQLSFQIGIPSNLPKIYLDKERIVLVFQNLLDNAVKYTPEYGKIKLTVNKKGKAINIIIRDNGVGVPANDQKKLFSKFFRAENVVRMQTEGSGLGLFIVRNIIRKHGGEIEIESDEGVGTAAIISLPIKDRPQIID